MVSANCDEGSCALGFVWNYDGQFPTPRLRGAQQPNSDLAIASCRIQHQMKVLVRVRLMDKFLKRCDGIGEDVVDHHDQTTLIRLLILTDQPLSFVAPGMECLVQRGGSGGGGRRRAGCQS